VVAIEGTLLNNKFIHSDRLGRSTLPLSILPRCGGGGGGGGRRACGREVAAEEKEEIWCSRERRRRRRRSGGVESGGDLEGFVIKRKMLWGMLLFIASKQSAVILNYNHS
jgi:hypothetical protein